MVTDKYYKNLAITICVTLAVAKKHLRVSTTNTSEDELIQGYIDAATADRQNYINRSVDTSDFIMEVSQFETVCFSVNNDNDEVAKVEYYAPGETVLATLDATAYKVRPGDVAGTKTIKFANPPATINRADAVIITVKQGWETADVPKPFKQAILLVIADMYERREDRGEIGNNSAANSLCRQYRKF